MKNYVDLDHDQLEKQWASIFENEATQDALLKEIQELEVYVNAGNYQSMHEGGAFEMLADLKNELKNLQKS